METYTGPHAERFIQAVLVNTGREIESWVEKNPVMANDDWRVEAYTDTGESNGECFILAVSTPAGLVGFFAATKDDADRIHQSMS
jgi:hypothetical protein